MPPKYCIGKESNGEEDQLWLGRKHGELQFMTHQEMTSRDTCWEPFTTPSDARRFIAEHEDVCKSNSRVYLMVFGQNSQLTFLRI